MKITTNKEASIIKETLMKKQVDPQFQTVHSNGSQQKSNKVIHKIPPSVNS